MSRHERGNSEPAYVGRFAPSPTGSLHFGSLVAATASYLEARRREGSWLIRIDDIDPPREVPGSAESIVQDLTALGFSPDGPVFWQSQRMEDYRDACEQLLEEDRAYWCGCSRRDLPPGPYPGTCRDGLPVGKAPRAVRLKAKDQDTSFVDAIQGPITVDLSSTCGDFVIWRADQLPAYQLATGIDDVFQGISQVVRGADLLDSTPRQMAVQEALDLGSPSYAHVPIVLLQGKKLSKCAQDTPLSAQDPILVLRQALGFLGQRLPPQTLSLGGLWDWAIEHWEISDVPRVRALDISEISGPERQNVIL